MTTPDRTATPTPLPWIPIRSLGVRHREQIASHLRELSTADRYLRFGQAISDEQIGRYVQALNFKRDEIFGIFNRRLKLVAMAHLAYASAPQRTSPPAMAEFGVSVLSASRGRGYGARMFERAVTHARNRGTECLFIHALTQNTAMLKIARRAGAVVERDGSESQAWLKLPRESIASQVEELVETRAAEFNYRLKRHALGLERLVEAVRALRAQVGKHGVASQ